MTNAFLANGLPFDADENGWRAHHDFLSAAKNTPDALALNVEGVSYTYAQVRTAAEAIAEQIALSETESTRSVVGVYVYRCLASYAGMLAAAMRGCTYVPLNPKFPEDRNATILERSESSFLVHRTEDAAVAAKIINAAGTGATPISCDLDMLAAGAKNPLPAPRHNSPHINFLFTSGSTGMPKGVMLRHSNLSAYLDAVFEVADYGPNDRLSQTFDMTFDLSVHDIFVCWRAGASLFVPSLEDLDNPADFLHKHDVNCWFSVPTLARKIMLQGALGKGALSNLRLSLFCGEALPMDLAKAWKAATGQRVENWYGPTEAQSCCMYFPFPDDVSAIEGRFDLVPIGRGLPKMETLVVDEDGNVVADGEMGELLVTGPQVTDGYLNDPEKTAAAFIKRAGSDQIYYRTGDRVLVDSNGDIQFIDRLDNQIKIRGYRVELGEIESQLRDASNGLNTIVVPLPLKSATPTALAAAVENFQGNKKELLAKATEGLPDYMTPSQLLSLPDFPTNASGKIDRGAVGKMVLDALEDGAKRGGSRKRKTGKKKNKQIKKITGKKPANKLIATVQKINPALSRDAILEADNLMEAGLDSLGFVNFTVVLEKKYGLPLDQEMVSELSYLPLKAIARRIARLRLAARKDAEALTRAMLTDAPSAGAKKKKKRKKVLKAERKAARKLERETERKSARKAARKAERKAGRAAMQTQIAKPEAKAKKRRKAIEPKFHQRAQRTLSFLDAFPELVSKEAKPIALFLGSSGFQRGINPQDVEVSAAKQGINLCAANAGLGALNVEGIAQAAEYVRDTANRAGKRLAWSVAELDIMHVSTMPPSGDFEIVNEYLAGTSEFKRSDADDEEAVWNLETRGTLKAKGAIPEKTVEPDWMKKRGTEVRDAYLGKIEFNPEALTTWLRGVHALAEVSDKVIIVVHPINFPDLAQARKAAATGRYEALLESVHKDIDAIVIDECDFELTTDDYLDRNHLNWWQGREKLSSQIVEHALKAG